MSVAVDLRDAHGNPATQATETILWDLVKPELTITSAQFIGQGNQSSYLLEGGCSEIGRPVKVSIGTSAQVSIDCASDSSWEHPGAIFVEGLNEVAVEHEDTAGNITDLQLTIVQDTVAPVLTVSSPLYINIQNKDNYSLGGGCEGSLQVTVGVNSAAEELVNCSNDTWSLPSFDAANASDGIIEITLAQEDEHGNSAAHSQSITRDTVAPTIAISDAQGVISYSNQASYRVFGSCDEQDAQITVTIEGLGQSLTSTARNSPGRRSRWISQD